MHKEHITDWIRAHTSAGETLVHSRLHDSAGKWQFIAAMAAPADAQGHWMSLADRPPEGYPRK